MATRKDPANEEALRKRIKWIVQITGLEIVGFAEFVGISVSHLYAILNGNKKLTYEMARRIARKFKLKPEDIFDLDKDISKEVQNAPALKRFMVTEREMQEYFQATRDSRKASHYIAHTLVNAPIFKDDEPIYLWEIQQYCVLQKRYYSSDELSKYLNEQVIKGKLRSEKRPIKKRDGTYGVRKVNVYFKGPESGRKA